MPYSTEDVLVSLFSSNLIIEFFLLQSYQIICEKYPSFRERSENVDLVVEISLQPWKVFKPDGVSDIDKIHSNVLTCGNFIL